MSAAKVRKRKKSSNGQRQNAGRQAFGKRFLSGQAFAHMPQAQQLALRLLGRGMLLLVLLVLASSTISDPLQRLVQQGLNEAQVAGHIASMTDADVQARASLLRRVAEDADAVRDLKGDDLLLLFGQPGLKRAEAGAQSWHYVSAECALDIYFAQGGVYPVYAEYRLRDTTVKDGRVKDGATIDAQQSCVRSLFAGAQRTALLP